MDLRVKIRHGTYDSDSCMLDCMVGDGGKGGFEPCTETAFYTLSRATGNVSCPDDIVRIGRDCVHVLGLLTV